MGDKMQCDKCGKLKSKQHNITRHNLSCKGRVLVDVEPDTPIRSQQHSSSGLTATVKDDGHKCTKHQFIHLLMATYNE